MKNIKYFFLSLFCTLTFSSCGILGGFTGTYIDKDEVPALILYANGKGLTRNGPIDWESPDLSHVRLIYPDGNKVMCSFVERGVLVTLDVSDSGDIKVLLVGNKL